MHGVSPAPERLAYTIAAKEVLERKLHAQGAEPPKEKQDDLFGYVDV